MRRLAFLIALAVPPAAAFAQSAPPPAVTLESGRVTVAGSRSVSTDVVFEVGSATLRRDAGTLLDAIARALATTRGTVAIDVHTDDVAPDGDRTGAYLLKLSQQRADALKAYLARRGVPAKRLVARGQGANVPVGDNVAETGRRVNRRIEIELEAEVRAPLTGDLATYLKRVPGRGPKLTATIATTHGTITCELFPEQAPLAVANFVGLATGQKAWLDAKGKVVRDRPLYSGTTFHRVIPEFMIQGGDPVGTGIGGPGYQFANESPNAKHVAGSLAMANAGPDTNGSQFFITELATPWLDGRHTVFGACADLDVIAEIARVPKDAQNRPTSPVTIRSIRIGRAP